VNQGRKPVGYFGDAQLLECLVDPGQALTEAGRLRARLSEFGSW
jgi:hypothetical protein